MQSNKADGNKAGKKTYKREIAVALFLWLGYLVETKPPEVLEVVAFPIFTFGALAFGLSWYSPNGGLLRSSRPPDGGWTERGSQHPSGQDEQSNSGNYIPDRTDYSEAPSEGHPPIKRHE